MTWLTIIINILVPITLKFIDLIPHYWNRKGKEAKMVKKGKVWTTNKLQRFTKMSTHEEIIAAGKKFER